MAGGDSGVVHEVMQGGCRQFQFVQNAELANLPMMDPRPAPDLLVDVMQHGIGTVQPGSDVRAVGRVVSRMDLADCLQQVPRLSVRLSKSAVVRVVVVHVQAQIVEQDFQTPRQVVDMSKRPEFQTCRYDRLCRVVTSGNGHRPRPVVMDAGHHRVRSVITAESMCNERMPVTAAGVTAVSDGMPAAAMPSTAVMSSTAVASSAVMPAAAMLCLGC